MIKTMRMHVTLCLAFTLAVAAQSGAPPKSKNVFVGEVPKSAKEVRPDVFRQEEGGKQIIYIRTPFGVTKLEQTEEMRKVIEEGPPLGITARETDDTYIFERRTPFGRAEWKKKKGSEEKLDLLTGDEKDALEYYHKLMDKAKIPEKAKEKP
jgi:hypothetical protein